MEPKKKNIIEIIVKVIVAALTAFVTAITTTSCMGIGPFFV
jgi:hypothetical protein